MDTTLEVFLIIILVALSALYSGMETALVSLNDVRLRRQLEELGKQPPKTLLLWRDKPNDVLTTLLIGNNIVNITASALATDFTHQLLAGTTYAGWGIPIAVGAMTMLVLIFGEVVPKTFAKHNPERYLALLPMIALSYRLFYPAMRVLVWLTRRFVVAIGGEIEGTATVTEEDIEEMVRIGKSDGSMSPVSTKLLTGIFDLDDKVAREVMVPRTDVKALPVDATMEAVVEMVSTSGYSRYPVYEESIDDIVGVLYVKDFMCGALEAPDAPRPRIKDMLRPPMVRPWNVNVQDLLVEMQRERVHMTIIASEYGGVAGIITLEDIIEEVFGPIYDEHDHRVESIRKQADGGWIVEGVVTMRELEGELGAEFPDDDEDYETVAGLLMMEAGAIPKEGFSMDYEGFRFEVLSADATRVLEVGVTRVPTPRALEAAG